MDSVLAILFDIDGTLLTTGGASAVAWRRAFADLYGISADIRESTHAGMTDPEVGRLVYRSKTPCRSVISGLSSGSGGSVVFVDHTAEYEVASDRAVYWHGGWLVVVVGGALVESLMRPMRIVVPRILG
jgi:hypothetical protein